MSKDIKDLQDLFESLTPEQFWKLAGYLDKKSLNPQSLEVYMAYIGTVYCAEKNVSDADLTEEEMNKVIDAFVISISLYANVLKGHMKLKGRMRLTDNESAKFSLTPAGVKDAERIIGDMGIDPENLKPEDLL